MACAAVRELLEMRVAGMERVLTSSLFVFFHVLVLYNLSSALATPLHP